MIPSRAAHVGGEAMRIVADRLFVAVLVLVGARTISVTLADTPSAAAPSPTATAASATPASSTPTTPSAAPAANASSVVTAKRTAITEGAPDAAAEKRLLAAGYKPEMHGGVKLFCRREQEIGSRLAVKKVCGTPEQLSLSAHDSQEYIQDLQRRQASGMTR